jgi:hypothetical protein
MRRKNRDCYARNQAPRTKRPPGVEKMPKDQSDAATDLIRSRVPITVRLGDGFASFSRCRREWEKLAPTQLQSVRHCALCVKDVHLVADLSGFAHALAEGRCIAVSVEDELHCGGEGVGYDTGRGGPSEW